MKFKFGLEKVLKHRKTLEDLAQKDFQEALAVFNAHVEKLNLMEGQKTDARVRCFQLQSQTGGQVLEDLRHIHQFIVLQDIRIAEQRKTIEEAEKLVESKREILRQKAMDKKILERLKEKQKADYNSEKRREEQKDIDDIVSMRFEKNKETRNL